MAVGEFEGATKVTKGEGPTTQVKSSYHDLMFLD